MKSLIIAVFVTIISFSKISSVNSSPFSTTINNHNPKPALRDKCSNVLTEGYTYQLVYENGMWWMYVYDENGVLIDKIPLNE